MTVASWLSLLGAGGVVNAGGGGGTPGVTTHFTVSAPANSTTGHTFTFTVTAKDFAESTATGYSGTALFSSSDTAAFLPFTGTLTNGVGTFTTELNTATTHTLTATDSVSGSITGHSAGILDVFYTFLDTFQDTNNTALTSHTMDSGSGWAGYGSATGKVVRTSAAHVAAQVSVGTGVVQGIVSDAGVADVLLVAELYETEASNPLMLALRVDTANSGGHGIGSGWYVQCLGAGNANNIQIKEATGGSFQAQSGQGATAVQPSGFDGPNSAGLIRISALLSGNNFTVSYENANTPKTQLFTLTNSFNNTFTKFGLAGTAAHGNLRNLQVLPASATFPFYTIPKDGGPYWIAIYFGGESPYEVPCAAMGYDGVYYYHTPITYTPPLGVFRDPDFAWHRNRYYVATTNGSSTLSPSYSSNTINLASCVNGTAFTDVGIGVIDFDSGNWVYAVVPTEFIDADDSFHMFVALGVTGYSPADLHPYEIHSITDDKGTWSAPVEMKVAGGSSFPTGVEDIQCLIDGTKRYLIFDLTGTYRTRIYWNNTSDSITANWTDLGFTGDWMGTGSTIIASGEMHRAPNGDWLFFWDDGSGMACIRQKYGTGDWRSGSGGQTLPWTNAARLQLPCSSTPRGLKPYVLRPPGAVTKLALDMTSIVVAGVVTMTVNALDVNGNPNTAYTGTVGLTCSDGSATLPSAKACVSGQAVFSATLATSGSQHLTITDQTTGSITGSTAYSLVNGPAFTGLAAWWDANQVGIGAVNTWTDASGNGKNATRPFGYTAPVNTANQINGLPAVVFNGPGIGLVAGSAGDFQNTAHTAFVVFQCTAPDALNCLVNKGDGQTAEGSAWEIIADDGGGITKYDTFVGDTNEIVNGATQYTGTGAWQCVTVRRDSNNRKTIWKNGVRQNKDSDGGQSMNSVTNLLGIGSDGGGNSALGFIGAIAEIVYCNNACTEAERIAEEYRLRAKYKYA